MGNVSSSLPFISLCPKKRNKERLSWLNSQTSAVDALPVMRFACALELRALLKVVVAYLGKNMDSVKINFIGLGII